MGSNDTYSFSATETLVPSGETTRSAGVTITKQATRMGLIIVAQLTDADPIDGTYTVLIETADAGEGASGSWNPNVLDSVTFDAVGTYQIQMTQPVIDKVRARVVASGATPDAVSLRLGWLSDTTLTLIT